MIIAISTPVTVDEEIFKSVPVIQPHSPNDSSHRECPNRFALLIISFAERYALLKGFVAFSLIIAISTPDTVDQEIVISAPDITATIA